jgi:hypothetical protein
LKGYVVDEIVEAEYETKIYCHPRVRGMWLNGEYSKQIVETKVRRIAHMMLEGHQIILMISQRRFSFKGTRRWEKLPNIEKYKQTTNTFRLNTLRELQRDNYSGSGRKRGKSGMFPMKLLDGLKMTFDWPSGVTKVGLDGKYVKKRELVHHIADLDRGKSLGILPNLSQKDLKKNF